MMTRRCTWCRAAFLTGGSAFPVVGESTWCRGAFFEADGSAFPVMGRCIWCHLVLEVSCSVVPVMWEPVWRR